MTQTRKDQAEHLPAIGTCWNADRLDIGRVGMPPSAQYMSTVAGKDMAARV